MLTVLCGYQRKQSALVGNFFAQKCRYLFDVLDNLFRLGKNRAVYRLKNISFGAVLIFTHHKIGVVNVAVAVWLTAFNTVEIKMCQNRIYVFACIL